jgi:hypothetical protein
MEMALLTLGGEGRGRGGRRRWTELCLFLKLLYLQANAGERGERRRRNCLKRLDSGRVGSARILGFTSDQERGRKPEMLSVEVEGGEGTDRKDMNMSDWWY